MTKRLLIDTIQGQDDQGNSPNNVYLPESTPVGGSVATGGSIKIDSATIEQGASASRGYVDLDFSNYYYA